MNIGKKEEKLQEFEEELQLQANFDNEEMKDEEEEEQQKSIEGPKLPKRGNRNNKSRSRNRYHLSNTQHIQQKSCIQKNQKEDEKINSLTKAIKLFEKKEFFESKQLLTKYIFEMKSSYGEENELAKSKAYYYLGCTQKKLHDLDDSIFNLRISLNKYKKYLGKHALEVANTHFMLGNVYKKMNNFKEAVEYHRKALSIRSQFQSQDPSLIAISNFYLGKVYNKKSDPKQAILYHQKALKVCPANCKQLAADINTWIGIDNFQLKLNKEALEYFKSALKLQQEEPTINQKMPMGWSFYWIGVIQRNLKNNQASIESFLQAEKIFKENNQDNEQILSPIYDDLAGIYLDQEMYNLALKYYLLLEKIVDKEKIDQGELAEIYAGCGFSYKELKEYQNAVSYLTIALKLFEKYGKTVGVRKRFHKNINRDQQSVISNCLLALGESLLEIGKQKEAQKALLKVKQFFTEENYQKQFQKIQELMKKLEIKQESK